MLLISLILPLFKHVLFLTRFPLLTRFHHHKTSLLLHDQPIIVLILSCFLQF